MCNWIYSRLTAWDSVVTRHVYRRFLVLRMLQRCLVTSVIGQHAGTKLDCEMLSAKDWFGNCVLCTKVNHAGFSNASVCHGFKVDEALPSPGSLYFEGWICWFSSFLSFCWLLAETSGNTSCSSGWRSAISSTAFTQWCLLRGLVEKGLRHLIL